MHADDYAREAHAHPGVTLEVTWDDDHERVAVKAAEYGMRFEPELVRVLADPAIDGVILTSETTAHGPLIRAAAGAGKHIFLEKVIASTLAETEKLLEVIAGAGITAMVALDRSVEPATERALAMIAAGEIGAVMGTHVRLAHDGALPTPEQPTGWLPERFFDPAESGGGALIDLGAHPLYLTRLFLGMPDTVTAELGYETERATEDTAQVTFALGERTGLAETGFTSRERGLRWSVSGTDATITYEGGAWLHLRRMDDPPGTPETQIDLSTAWPRPFARWVNAVQTGASTTDNLALARDLSALVEAGYESARTGEAVRPG